MEHVAGNALRFHCYSKCGYVGQRHPEQNLQIPPKSGKAPNMGAFHFSFSAR